MLATANQSQAIRLRLPKLHLAQRATSDEAARFNVLVAGRRFGKNVLFRDIAIHPALHGHPVGWFAPSYRMLTDDYREMKALLSPLVTQANEAQKTLRLITGGVIDFWSLANPDSPRGRKYKTVIINEAGYVKV